MQHRSKRFHCFSRSHRSIILIVFTLYPGRLDKSLISSPRISVSFCFTDECKGNIEATALHDIALFCTCWNASFQLGNNSACKFRLTTESRAYRRIGCLFRLTCNRSCYCQHRTFWSLQKRDVSSRYRSWTSCVTRLYATKCSSYFPVSLSCWYLSSK